jgi:hypothetical protein
VEFMGVTYTVTAEPTQDIDNFGITVRVAAEITDGKAHAFVNDTVETAKGPTALRFDVEAGSDEHSEARFSGNMNLDLRQPGESIEFTRSYPGPKDEPLARGDVLELTVGIWGTEDADGGQRYAPDLAHISMTVPESGLGDPVLAALDPAADMPEEFASWDYGFNKVVIKPYHPLKEITKTGGSEVVAVYEVGDTVVRIKDNELVVGELYYGKFGKQDGILVDNGKVSVGGQDRTGEPMEKEDLVEYYPTPFSEHEMGPYKVQKSPGATKYGVMNVGKNYRLVLDGLEIRVDEGNLYVAGVCYGKVPAKATIHLYFDEVKVGKQKREPSDKCK